MKSIYQTFVLKILLPLISILFYIPRLIFNFTIKRYTVFAKIINNWALFCMRMLNQPYEVEGIENIDPSKRYVVICNHGSIVDIIAIPLVLKGPVTWVMKDSLLKMPFFSTVFKMALGIAIPRSNARKSKEIIFNKIEVLRARINPNIIIYPEGTRTKTGELNPFKRGFVQIMRHYGMDILPITLSGFNTFASPKKFFVNPSPKLKIIIHPVQKHQDLESLEDKEIIQKMQKIISENYYA